MEMSDIHHILLDSLNDKVTIWLKDGTKKVVNNPTKNMSMDLLIYAQKNKFNTWQMNKTYKITYYAIKNSERARNFNSHTLFVVTEQDARVVSPGKDFERLDSVIGYVTLDMLNQPNYVWQVPCIVN